MKYRNYALLVEENSHYPVRYTIKQNGNKVIENTMLKGGDMTENQIKELFFLGYFEEKPTQEEIDEYLDIIGNKTHNVNKIADYMDVAEKLYYHINPNTRMEVPNSAYITTEKWYHEWIITDTELSLFDWCIKNKAK